MYRGMLSGVCSNEIITTYRGTLTAISIIFWVAGIFSALTPLAGQQEEHLCCKKSALMIHQTVLTLLIGR